MKKMTELRIQVFFFMLVLVLASLACYLPGSDLWVDVDDKGDVYVEEDGRKTILATADTENEILELPPENKSDGIPKGTYVGTSNYPEALANMLDPGQYTKNEVVVRVADDGTVSGSYSVYYIGDPFSTVWNEKECTGHWEADLNGTFFGQLTGSNWKIESEENWVCTDYTNCDDLWNACTTDEPIHREFNVYVSGDEMKGTTLPHPEAEDGLIWTFNAKKE